MIPREGDKTGKTHSYEASTPHTAGFPRRVFKQVTTLFAPQFRDILLEAKERGAPTGRGIMPSQDDSRADDTSSFL